MSESPVTSVEQLPEAVVVHVLARELRKNEVDEVCSAADQALAAAPGLPFILDLAKVDFAGSLAIGVLVGLNQEFRNRGQRLIFVNLQGHFREMIQISRVNRVVEMMPDVPAALRSVGAGA